jgi:hypothetical protein
MFDFDLVTNIAALYPAAGGAPTAPDQFGTGDWSVADDGTSGDITITITALPSDGGSAITDLEYQIDGGSWVSMSGTTTGDYGVSGLTDDVEVDVAIRAVNAIGNGTASATKAVTPTLGAQVGIAMLYTGTGASNAISGAGISPDLVAIRARTVATGWRWTDNVRGVTKSIDSSSQNAEATEANGLTSFDADGFTVGSDTDYNDNGVNYIAFLFQEVADAFDIVAYAGNGTGGRTVAHGLGVTPELMIVKNRTTGATNWAVYPGPLSSPATKFLQFHTNNAVGTATSVWNDTAPTSSVFSVGTSSAVNTNTNNYIAWLFASKAGMTKVGTYTGDGANPGPSVTTGFRPRFVLIKRTDSTGNWVMIDNVSDATNPHMNYRIANGTGESTATGGLDFQATAFQFTGAADEALINTSGATYIYLAVC